MKGKVNLEWDDRDVLPKEVQPNLAFLFEKMEELTLKTVGAKEGERILDIGCGRAKDAVKLSKNGATVIGLEPSRVMLGYAKDNIRGFEVSLVRGVGEYLPFKPRSFDKVLCKGSLDHFFSPEKVIEEIARVLKEEGRAIISIANFECLGFKIDKILYRLAKPMFPKGRRVWEVPPDHTFKLDYLSLKRLLKGRLKTKRVIGVSFLFGLHLWGEFLSKLPHPLSWAILSFLDKIVRPFPSLADVIICECSPL